MMTTNNIYGLSGIAQLVANTFNIKTYTEQMFKYIQNPLSYPMSQIETAYQYFQAMYNNTSFQVPGGPTLDFSHIPPTEAASMHSLVIKTLSDFDNIQVQYKPGAYQPLMMNQVINGQTVSKPATLLDIVSQPPGATFSVSFKGNPDQMDDDGTSPPWAPGFANSYSNAFSAGRSLERAFHNVSLNFGIAGTGLSCHFYDGAWNFHTASFTISGSASDWIAAAGSMTTTSSDPAQAQADTTALAQFIQNHF